MMTRYVLVDRPGESPQMEENPAGAWVRYENIRELYVRVFTALARDANIAASASDIEEIVRKLESGEGFA